MPAREGRCDPCPRFSQERVRFSAVPLQNEIRQAWCSGEDLEHPFEQVYMTSVVATFKYHGVLGSAQAEQLGQSYTQLGIRKIRVDAKEQTLNIEYDATRMDRNGVVALLRGLRFPLDEIAGTKQP